MPRNGIKIVGSSLYPLILSRFNEFLLAIRNNGFVSMIRVHRIRGKCFRAESNWKNDLFLNSLNKISLLISAISSIRISNTACKFSIFKMQKDPSENEKVPPSDARKKF